MKKETPQCIIIAGPNGAGKTTFAKQFLAQEVNIIHFVNADLIAAGLSPLRPQLAEIAAGRLFLSELKKLAAAKIDFAFETTLSGHAYLRFLKKWKAEGYFIRIIYLRIKSPELSLDRIATRVTQGGHDVPREAVLRRFDRSWNNFLNVYREIADDWRIYENSGNAIQLIEKNEKEHLP
ncbi:MAG: zeta toxin family protein [Chthoniobacterales bacterium]|nr:zeta toxin family protein [Chthoniobacterales bacterium]